MGVESVDSSRSTKATKNSIDKGVAGRSMIAIKGGESGAKGRLANRPSRLAGGVEVWQCAARVWAWESGGGCS